MSVADARRAVAFLTPLGGATAPAPQALAWFPLVGAALGAALGLAWWGLDRIAPPAVAAAGVVALDLGLTGMLHLDGVADSADGLLPHLDRARRLAVMREPCLGAFGLAAGAVTLLVRWSAFFSMAPSVLLVVALWTASRTAMAATATAVPYARADGGLATAFLGESATRSGWTAVVVGVPLAVGCAVAARPVAGPVALAAGAAAAGAVVLLAVRRVGGFTGDVLGAAGIALETVGLVVGTFRW
ncbi:MAG: adenosylcobinamide-GDP ribazoletransferase [Acidimicrobiales bacterium]